MAFETRPADEAGEGDDRLMSLIGRKFSVDREAYEAGYRSGERIPVEKPLNPYANEIGNRSESWRLGVFVAARHWVMRLKAEATD